jgi:beta-glucosidase
LREILRGEWDFDGLVVSDWGSVPQLIDHGLTADKRAAVLAAVEAGIDLEMASGTFVDHLEDLVRAGHIEEAAIDAAVANILRVKFRLGLFENPYTDPAGLPPVASDSAVETARQAALESVVLLKNDRQTLPLNPSALDSLAVIGPLADDAYEQLGTWVFDGDPNLSVTPLEGIRSLVGASVDVHYAQGLETSRSHSKAGFDEAVRAAEGADAAVLFLGEESILSGEAHCRANIDLPGEQEALIRRVRAAGKPVIAVIMAGRPLTLTNVAAELDAILYAWHPGTMGGAAIADHLPEHGRPGSHLLQPQEHRQTAIAGVHRADRRYSGPRFPDIVRQHGLPPRCGQPSDVGVRPRFELRGFRVLESAHEQRSAGGGGNPADSRRLEQYGRPGGHRGGAAVRA